MGAYTSIRGWIEVHDKSLNLIRNILADHESRAADFGMNCESAEFYNKGWLIPEHCINWTHYIFYGADIRTQSVDFIRSEMSAIAKVFFADEDIDDDWGFHPTGVVHVREDGTFGHPDEVWNLDGGELTCRPTKREQGSAHQSTTAL